MRDTSSGVGRAGDGLDRQLDGAAGVGLLLDASRSSAATMSDVAAPSRMEQSAEVASGRSQLVQRGSGR
ncbi:MAG: hypothetical protein JOZ20_07165 [Sphingomonas sp.]|nr:hypothetical protein [Sphingomonas sp.]